MTDAQTQKAIYSPALENIIVAETTLSHVDGDKGELLIRGHRIDDLAGKVTFEEAAKMLWSGFLMQSAPASEADHDAIRQVAFKTAQRLEPAAQTMEVIEFMRACLDALPMRDEWQAAEQILQSLPVFLAAGFRAKQNQPILTPKAGEDLASNLLYMLLGREPQQKETDAINRYLVTIIDHGLNASTFTARVIAATQSDMRSAISGAIGALKGPLHGGAPGPVLDMIDAIGTPQKADQWIKAELDEGRRLMGFGHRVYRTRDPRADVLKAGLADLKSVSSKIDHAQAIEQAALTALSKHKPDRVLQTNVEFYTAILLDAVGIDRSLFTPLFAVGRCAGWAAHVLEQSANNKLIRPQSVYVGPTAAA